MVVMVPALVTAPAVGILNNDDEVDAAAAEETVVVPNEITQWRILV